MQVQTFFHTETEYSKKPAICARLDRVPGMSASVKEKIKHYISREKDMGTNNKPRQFNPVAFAHSGKACILVLVRAHMTYFL